MGLAVLATALAAGAAGARSTAAAGSPTYEAEYVVRLEPDSGTARVTLAVRQSRALLRQVRIPANPRFDRFEGEGLLEETGGLIVWEPPAAGGALEWTASIAHRRNGDGYDAWLGPDWGLFRAEDLIPRAVTRTLKGASSRTTLRFDLPRDWSVITQYPEDDGKLRVDNPQRRFDQPTGWILAGGIGVRRETIAGMRVAVAGPIGQSVRRLDTLALLNWTLPELARLLPSLPPRLTVFLAGEPMWRGGLSAPRSLFMHADRPLISENATSTLLHEVMHLALGLRAKPGYDWIVEGFAEFYSLELLRRGGSITARRYRQARTQQSEWAETAGTLCAPRSTGATTALAVTLLVELDAELRRGSAGTASLDDVTRDLVKRGPVVGLDELQASFERVAGGKPDILHIDDLPGCRKIGGTG